MKKSVMAAAVATLSLGLLSAYSVHAESQLSETSWELISLNAKKVAEPEVFGIHFTDSENVSIGTDCNNCGTQYNADLSAQTLSFAALACTKMACTPPGLEQEYVDALQTVESYTITGSTLVLEGTGTVLTYRKAGSDQVKPDPVAPDGYGAIQVTVSKKDGSGLESVAGCTVSVISALTVTSERSGDDPVLIQQPLTGITDANGMVKIDSVPYYSSHKEAFVVATWQDMAGSASVLLNADAVSAISVILEDFSFTKPGTPVAWDYPTQDGEYRIQMSETGLSISKVSGSSSILPKNSGRTTQPSLLTFSPSGSTARFYLAESKYLKVAAYTIDGRRMDVVTGKGMFSAGYHTIQLKNPGAAAKAAIVHITGDGINSVNKTRLQ